MPENSQHAAGVSWRAESPNPAGLATSRRSRRSSATPPSITNVSRAIVAVLNALIWLYQHTLSPALAVAAPSCGCRFAPTCSHYAQDALREHGVLAGLWLTLRRLAKCGPWHPGGLDPVPPSQTTRRRQLSCSKVNPPAASADRSPLTAHRSLSPALRSLS